MWYYQYDLLQLQRIAEDKLREYDAERLTVPKKIDVFDFTEFYLGVYIDPQRLSPNQQVLGVTAFNDGYWYIWPEGNRLPARHPVRKGTILVDDRLLDDDSNEGRLNFTVIHEGFHWILHPKVFAKQEAIYKGHYSKDNTSIKIGTKKPQLSGIEITEWQANAATAAFLMPREAVTFAFREVMKVPVNRILPIPCTLTVDSRIGEIADMFSASYTSMKYRLIDLGLIAERSFRSSIAELQQFGGII